MQDEHVNFDWTTGPSSNVVVASFVSSSRFLVVRERARNMPYRHLGMYGFVCGGCGCWLWYNFWRSAIEDRSCSAVTYFYKDFFTYNMLSSSFLGLAVARLCLAVALPTELLTDVELLEERDVCISRDDTELIGDGAPLQIKKFIQVTVRFLQHKPLDRIWLTQRHSNPSNVRKLPRARRAMRSRGP